MGIRAERKKRKEERIKKMVEKLTEAMFALIYRGIEINQATSGYHADEIKSMNTILLEFMRQVELYQTPQEKQIWNIAAKAVLIEFEYSKGMILKAKDPSKTWIPLKHLYQESIKKTMWLKEEKKKKK